MITNLAPSPLRRACPRRVLVWSTGAALLVVGLCLVTPAGAQEVSGGIVGQITDERAGTPLPGLTVVAQGPQGEEATLADEQGRYSFTALPVGSYTVRVYAVGATTAVERPQVLVSAGRTVRIDIKMPPVQAASQTYVIERRAPMIDVGGNRTGMTLRREEFGRVPGGTNYGDVMDRTPGAFVDRSGSVSIAGASGLENVYLLDGLNVTGIEYGDIMNGRPNASGGSNLPLAFIEELSVTTGGYSAEYGGAMGGVVNVVTRSGSNRFQGSVFSRLSPSWLEGTQADVGRSQSSLLGRHQRSYDLELGGEVGGPIVPNVLFFWAGFAPRHDSGHFVREVRAQIDADGDGQSDLAADGQLASRLVDSQRSAERRRSYPFGAKLTFVPASEHRLNLGVFATPTSSLQSFDRTLGDAEAAASPSWARQEVSKRNTDVVASWTGYLHERRWRMDANLGLHDERYKEGSPSSELNELNQAEWHGASLFDLEGHPECQPVMRGDRLWDPCPVDLYRTGGYGHLRSYSAQRWAGDIKSTHLFTAGGTHELKYGGRLELAVFDQSRRFSGPAGSRGLVQHFPGATSVWSFFSLPRGRHPFEFADGAPGNVDPLGNGSPAELAGAPFYRDQLDARVKNVAPALFLQDAYSPRPNLTLNAGLRFEQQQLFDYRGERFATLNNLGMRGGVTYDPTNEGRSKLFGHYGRFFEAIPLNLAARYFGGEGILIRNYDNTGCPTPPRQWQGRGEWQGCPLQPQNPPASSPYAFFNNGSNYPVQPHLRGQHHDEIVAGAQYELRPGLLLGAEYTRRWLGVVIEDGTAADGTFVLANPGAVPGKALQELERDLAAKEAQLAAAAMADRPALEAEAGALRSTLANLRGLAAAPRPERTYDGLTLSAVHRPNQRLTLQAWYTYSRLYGNYNGLHDADNNYFAPNGGNAYDTPDLVLNKRGRLANDRPHTARFIGSYDQPLSASAGLSAGLLFSVFSGVPRNHQSALIPGQQLVFLLPRGSAGRTPTVSQLDARLSYRHRISSVTSIELAAEVFNLLNRRTPLRVDDNYTFDMAAAIVDGSAADLPHARSIAGQPVTVNPNFGRATAYQAPINGRLSLRAFF